MWEWVLWFVEEGTVEGRFRVGDVTCYKGSSLSVSTGFGKNLDEEQYVQYVKGTTNH